MPEAAFFARARTAAELLMEDTCAITRDPQFVADSTLDTATGSLTTGPTSTIYAGACTVTPVTRQQAETDEGGAPLLRLDYRASIPVDAPEVAVGDVLTVTASVRDAQLVGQRFVVRATPVSTNAYQRPLLVELTVRADAQ